MISSLHGLFDDRIYWKEALSLKKNGYDVIHLSIGENDREYYSEHGIRLITVGKKRFFRNPYIDILFRKLTLRPGVYRKMLKICAGLRADVYHFHDIQINKIGRQLKMLPHAPRVIYDVHEDYSALVLSHNEKPVIRKAFVWLYASWLRRWELSKARGYDYILPAYAAIENIFLKAIDRQKISIILNYTTLSPVLDTPSYADKKFDAIYCGQISKFRGAMELLQASKILVSKLPRFTLLLLGPIEGSGLRHNMELFIEDNCLQGNIFIHEPVPYSEMDTYYRESRVGLGIFMPIRIFYTAIQIKTFEYMAYGLPIVCSNFGNIFKFVTSENCGIAVNPESPAAIAGALHQLLTDRNLYETMSKNGISAVHQKYHWEKEEEKLLNIYRQLLTDKK
jgi:glycosyltransferase involved in cell wall biosynthesis